MRTLRQRQRQILRRILSAHSKLLQLVMVIGHIKVLIWTVKVTHDLLNTSNGLARVLRAFSAFPRTLANS